MDEFKKEISYSGYQVQMTSYFPNVSFVLGTEINS